MSDLDGRSSLTLDALPVPVLLGRDVGRASRSGVTFMRDRIVPDERTVVRLTVGHELLDDPIPVSLPVARAPRAVLDGIRLAEDEPAAVAFVDACANAGWVDLVELRRQAERRSGWRHVSAVRRALALADPAARSIWESRLRVLYVVVAGLPRPLVNVPIFDREGRFLAIADLLDPRAALVVEFDGRLHRGRRQHRADNEREELLEDAGLTVVRVDSLDLTRHEQQLVRRLRSGHERGLRRDRRHDRWTLEEPTWWLEEHGDIQLSDDEKAALYDG